MEHYNTKKSDDKIDGAQFHLERKNVALYGDELLHYAVQKHDDLFLKSGTALLLQDAWLYVLCHTRGYGSLAYCHCCICCNALSSRSFHQEAGQD